MPCLVRANLELLCDEAAKLMEPSFFIWSCFNTITIISKHFLQQHLEKLRIKDLQLQEQIDTVNKAFLFMKIGHTGRDNETEEYVTCRTHN
jgi:hypothetical protein